MSLVQTLVKNRLAVSAAFLAVLSTGAWWLSSEPKLQHDAPPSVQPLANNQSKLVAKLLDQRNAATLLPREAFAEQVSLPVSSIDTEVDRRTLLAALFSKVTAGQQADQLKVEAWVRYLQDRVAHPKWPPIFDNGQAIYDPLWILKNQSD